MNKLRAYLTGKNLYSIFLHLVVVILAIEVVILARQNRQFKEGQDPASQESVKVGDYLSLSGIVPVDTIARLDSTSERQVIFVFTTRCPFCKETLPLWRQIAHQAEKAENVALIGICLDHLAETKVYVEEQKLTYPVFVAEDKESFVKKNKLHGVPQTIIRATSGRVERVWKGRLSEQEFREVVRAISHITHNKHSNS